MTGYVALLRAVNVGGTGKLLMSTLIDLCEAAGFAQVRTHIASGNVVFRSDGTEGQIRSVLEGRLQDCAGKSVGVVVRTASEIADVLVRNPFNDAPGNRVMALFVDGPLPAAPFDGAIDAKDEQIRLGKRELFVLYPGGTATTRLHIPSPHYSREMRDQSQTVDIAHNYANGLFDEVFCNEISGPGVWWPRPISGGPMNYSG